MPTVGSLFTGIGGLDLGLERAGWTIRWQVERDPYCRRVLARHWPQVTRYADIREVHGRELAPVDCICGGFPCQPVSAAGQRFGAQDDGWLWPEFARLVRVVRPRFVLVENVPGLRSLGLGDVLGDLAGLGYDAEWESLPATAVGAPHLRERLFIVAYPRRQPAQLLRGRDLLAGPTRAPESQKNQRQRGGDAARAGGAALPDADGPRRGVFEAYPAAAGTRGQPQLAVDRWWDVEPDVGRVVDGVPTAVDRLRALGNAVVPQVAEWIGRRLQEVAS